MLNLKATAYYLLILSINLLQPLFAVDNTPQNNSTPCEFKSELVPDATLRHLPKLDKVGASSSRYKLIYKGKQIKNFSFTQFQGYGTHMTIDPYLTIRYMPAIYGTKNIPKEFTSSRESAEWWCSQELKRFRSKGYLSWTRREQTFFERGGSNPWQCKATFEEPPACAWMQVAGSSEKFIFQEND